ncbi:MAG: sulfatase [Planctomycetes bacterium TMED75]|nr:sulfatase [Planctomycetaceae bacterium]OUU95733.1 MAG: sulfatase [Planctomycetes bacterium TMED75]
MPSTIVLACLLLAASPPDDRPNILFIMSDDHAWQAISQYGADRNQTPNIDRIGLEGMVFDRHFVENSICAPSRAAILTGTFSHLHGVPTNAEKFDGSQPTFPALAQDAGYQTALIGKWHLKSEPVGFDHYQRLIGQGLYYGSPMIRNGERIETEGYITDLITDLSVEWLETQRDPDRPFMLMVQHKAPHREWMPGPDHLHDFEGVDLPEPATLFDDYGGRTNASNLQEMTIREHLRPVDLKLEMPEWMMKMSEADRAAWDAAYQPKNAALESLELEGDDLIRWKYQRYAKDYLRCIASVDDSVGALLAALDESGLADNTIVVYTSDQGWYLGEHGWYDKRWMYEESFRTPLLIRWPGVIEPGRRTELLSQNIDLAPTFLAAANVPVPDRMQGESLMPLLKASSDESVEDIGWRDALYYRYYESEGPHKVPKHEGVRTRRYKLIHFTDLELVELYDLDLDPDELNSVADAVDYASVRARLEDLLVELRAQSQSPGRTVRLSGS